MIKLESAHIEEVRGIRKLDINFQKSTFAISGPNGSGKSGVIDAIEFGLTGRIGRLTGRGTRGLTVAEHGPHVDKTKFPDAAFVELKVFIPTLGKSATITRAISAPNKPKITPADEDVKAILAEVAEHPEITLSRREILRFILVEPTTRSEEIQTILKLDDIGHLRSVLNTAQNKLQTSQRGAASQAQGFRESLQRHLQISTLLAKDLLGAVNKRRLLLGLEEISELTPDTKLDAGVNAAEKASDFNKQSSLRDIQALTEAIAKVSETAAAEVAAMLKQIEEIEGDPTLFAALQRRSFIAAGLAFVEGPDCPLCDAHWDDEARIREHLKDKLAQSEKAGKIQESLLKGGSAIAREASRLSGLVSPVQRVAETQGSTSLAQALANWKADLDGLKMTVVTVDGVLSLKMRLTDGWAAVPKTLSKSLSTLGGKVEAKPDQTATLDAQTFLSAAQSRLEDYRESMRLNKAAEIAYASARKAYDTYCRVLEDELNALYDDVEKDFSAYYRLINGDDEAKFTAKLTPSEGKLELDVNFYERGLYPPGAFHSEGHQDGMGVCLYLALMKRLFGNKFTFSLLDDVVMSVDVGHRHQFCKLLKTHFPDTQFVITTHDRLWAEQMRSAGLVTAKTSLAFHGWSIDTGPLVESGNEIWDEIAAALSKGKVESAAHTLRRHLEYVSRILADQLGASAQFRADGNYELGDLLPSVLARMKALYGKAADAAQSWGNAAAKEFVATRKTSLSNASAGKTVAEWAVNKAVHFNEWANFGKKDFEPVVAAFRELLSCFQCDACDSWLHITPRNSPESLRCACSSINLNLKPKPKSAMTAGEVPPEPVPGLTGVSRS